MKQTGKLNLSRTLEKKKRKRGSEDDEMLMSCLTKSEQTYILLGESMDAKVQIYLMRVQDGGGVVTAWIAVAAARSILLSCDHSKLAEFGGHAMLNRFWAYSLLRIMNFCEATSDDCSKHEVAEFERLTEFLQDVVTRVEKEVTPSELTLTWDQTD